MEDIRNPIADHSRAKMLLFGCAEYTAVLKLQQSIHEQRRTGGTVDTWLLGEHPAVITQGMRAEPTDLKNGGNGVPVVPVDRGGLTTLHSPGQLILYAIVRLRYGSLGAGRMTRALLQTMQTWLREAHGIEATSPDERYGLFVEGLKLMSVGISARGGVTMHGVAVNLSNDLNLWKSIVACGEPELAPISVSQITARPALPMEQADSLRNWLRTAWGYESVDEERISIRD